MTVLDQEIADSARERYVGIGQVLTEESPGRLNTILGSCVALMLYDTETRFGGMAHILLPGKGNENLKYADAACSHLVSEVRKRSVPSSRIIAKIAGGASTKYRGDSSLIGDIGKGNILGVITFLMNEDISIEGMHTGGHFERKILFDLENGDVIVSLSIKDPMKAGVRVI